MISQQDIELYIEMSSDSDILIQREAYRELSENLYLVMVSDPIILLEEQTEILNKGLSSSDDEIRYLSFSTLYDLYVECHSGTDYQNIIEKLDDNDERNRVIALRWLGAYQLETDLDKVLEIITNPAESDKIRVEALKTIGYQCRFNRDLSKEIIYLLKDAFEIVNKILQDKSPLVRAFASVTVSYFLQPSQPHFKTTLDIHPQKRQATIKTLLNLLRDPHEEVRSHTIMAISYLHEENLLKHIMPLLNDSSNKVIQSVFNAVCYSKYHAAAPLMFPMLQSESPQIRVSTLTALNGILSKKVIRPYLEQALDDEHPYVSSYARSLLGIK